MRTAPVSVTTGKRRAETLQLVPREGTKTRAIYDLFMANKGVPIDVTIGKHYGTKVIQLRDCYGLDIRNLGYRRWLLAGEWIGSVYVDYVADHLAKLEREAA